MGKLDLISLTVYCFSGEGIRHNADKLWGVDKNGNKVTFDLNKKVGDYGIKPGKPTYEFRIPNSLAK